MTHTLSWFWSFSVALVFLFSTAGGSHAYDRYNEGCQLCHGAFTDGTSPEGTLFPSDNKHTMHRSSQSMNTECNLCHSSGDANDPFIGSSDGTVDNPGLGCMGCHGRNEDAGHDSISDGLGAGLRQHHDNAGVPSCLLCHSDSSPANYTPVGEDVFPAYYGTVDTNVDEPCNELQMADMNENWSDDLDFVGLDNDGNLDYDATDAVCVPESPQLLLGLVGVVFPAVLSRRKLRRAGATRGSSRRTGVSHQPPGVRR
jgi:hypothetical protein